MSARLGTIVMAFFMSEFGLVPATSPTDGIESILHAFTQAPMVALGERQWAKEDAEFRQRLIRDPRFANTVNDLVVEFANPLYQDVLDRYVRGEPVSAEQLRHVWRDTTQPGTWDSPVYEQFLTVVREVNHTLLPGHTLRVVAGDAPVDWRKVRGADDCKPFLERRDEYAAQIVQEQVIAKDRKALLIYGAGHLYHGWNANLVSQLESKRARKVFVITPIGGEAAEYARFDALVTGPPPTFVLVRGTDWAKIDAAGVLERGTKRLKIVDGKRVVAPVFESPTPLGSLVDACLYFGRHESALAEADRNLANDPVYGCELQRRRTILSNIQ